MEHNVLDIIAKNSPHLSWIKKNTIFLSLAGSRAQGLENEHSDYDYRGVAVPSKEYFYGFNKKFEQAELKAPHPDAVIFDLQKFFSLSADGNPNTLEILFADESDHIIVNDIGRTLLDNRDKFLSRNLKERYIGYSKAQMHRMKNHKAWFDKEVQPPPTREEFGLPKELQIKKEQLLTFQAAIAKKLEEWNCDFEPFSEPQKIYLKGKVSEILSEMSILSDNRWELAARSLGSTENFIFILQREKAYQNVIDNFISYNNWKKNRNPKRALMEEKIGYDAKFACQLIRLLKIGKEVLLTGKLKVKRTEDREELLAIKNCQWSYDSVIEYADKIEKEVKEAYFNSPLPIKPDINYLDDLCIQLIEKSLST
jgi:predicted nucleotidyltransferase